MQPFTINVPGVTLDDLHRRLDRVRWPEDAPGSSDAYGIELADMRRYVGHWRDRYDWRRTEAELNAWPQFLVNAAGHQMHVLHVRADDPAALPLVLTHGWPGSIIEFLDCIEELRKTWHVVVVSMPGYGFSGPTRVRGVDVAAVADSVADVMTQLGYDRFVAQGGDWGGLVTRQLGEAHAHRTIAIHCNMIFAMPDAAMTDPMGRATEAERERMSAAIARISSGTGYMALQSTKPHAIGVALDDSPVGLAAWILEKFHAWTDSRDGMPISIDRLLDNVMLYWLNTTATSAARLYFEAARAGNGAMSTWTGRVRVPTGHAVYPFELLQTPRAWAEARYDIVHWNEQSRGGHFAAFEQPGLFCADLAQFRAALG